MSVTATETVATGLYAKTKPNLGDLTYARPMSQSLEDFRTSLTHADHLIAGTKTGRGKPSSQETSMFVASVALTYAAWESYVEDVAVECVDFLSAAVSADQVPASAQRVIEATKPTPWQLTIHPGWRSIWSKQVHTRAKGDPNSAAFGMNTAGMKQIRTLFEAVGLDFSEVIEDEDQQLIDRLIFDRGEVVHTASQPENFKKAKAKNYRDLVERVAVEVDGDLKRQMNQLVGSAAW